MFIAHVRREQGLGWQRFFCCKFLRQTYKIFISPIFWPVFIPGTEETVRRARLPVGSLCQVIKVGCVGRKDSGSLEITDEGSPVCGRYKSHEILKGRGEKE